MYKAFGIVSSSGRNIYVDGMQDYRPIGAFSFLGRYRVIDFPISNMTNSDIDRIQVYINNKPRSVVEQDVITTSTPRAANFSFSSQSTIMTMISITPISPAIWITWNHSAECIIRMLSLPRAIWFIQLILTSFYIPTLTPVQMLLSFITLLIMQKRLILPVMFWGCNARKVWNPSTRIMVIRRISMFIWIPVL